MNITLKKTSKEYEGYDFVHIIECKLFRKIKRDILPVGNDRCEGYVYEYQYECECWDTDKKSKLHIFLEDEMEEIRENYNLVSI